MMIVAFAALALAVLMVPTMQSAFAETVQGKDYDNTFLGVDQNGNYVYQWNSKPERMEIQPGQYVNYLLKDTDNYFRFESQNAGVQFNKSTCTLRLYDAGKVESGESPLVDSISMTLKEAEYGSDVWQPVSLNDQACELLYTTHEDGIQVTTRKSSQVMGFGPLFDTMYDVDYSGVIKTTFKYMNGDLAKSNHKYGFTQNFNGAFSVRVGTQEYDLSSLDSEVIFTKDNLDGKTIVIKKNGFSIEYDPQNYVHEYLWAVKLSRNLVTLDFTNSPGKLNIGDTLEIDPTYGYTAGTRYGVEGSAALGPTCATASYAVTATLWMVLKVDTTDGANPCVVSGFQWNISTIPDMATVTNSSLQIKVDTANSQQNINITSITHNLAASNPETIWNDIMNTANGTAYVANSGCCTTTGTQNVDLGATADTNIQSALTSDRFAVGFIDTSMVRDVSTRYFRTSATELSVTYTAPPPGPPSGVSCTSQARQMSCTWNPSTPSGGTQNGVITYYMGRSLDNSTYTNKTSVGNVTSTLSYAYWKINQLYHINMTANNGQNSTTSAHTTVTTDNFPSAPVSLYTTGLSDTSVKVNYGTPASNGNDPITGYRVQYCVVCTSWTTAVNKTNTLNYNITGLSGGSTATIRVAAWNGVALGTWSANVTGQTFVPTTGIVTLASGVVGDVVQLNTTVSITTASPSPVTVSSLKLYRNGTLVETRAVSVSIASGSSSSNFSPFWNQMTTGLNYAFKVYATVSNSTGTVSIGSANVTTAREYAPTYFAAIDPAEGFVNYTTARSNGEDTVNIKINRDKNSATFNVECLVQTNFQAQFGNGTGTWYNRTGQGYYNVTITGMRNTHLYGECINSGELLTFTSYTNSSLALFGIAAFDNTYGSFIGVPVGVLFIAMAAAMASQRTAPTWIVVVLGMIGLMATIGFFTIDTNVWALAIVAGMLGLFVGRKFF